MNNSDPELVQKIIEIVADITEIPGEMITAEKNLINDLEIDSLTMAEMVVVIQDRFGAELTNQDMQHMATIRDVADHLQHLGVTVLDAGR